MSLKKKRTFSVMKKGIIAGNWKMNLSLEEGIALAESILSNSGAKTPKGTVIIIPSYIHLSSVSTLLKHRVGFALGTQNCEASTVGELTGGVSSTMLESVGAQYVLVGHSERRVLLLEDNETLREKMFDILSLTSMIPIFCCGESKETRSSGDYLRAIEDQISAVLFSLKESALSRVIIAYEPRWAIGTGLIPSITEIAEVHAHIKNFLSQKFPRDVAEQVPLLYGGSCNAQNAASLYACPGVDGLLVGKASLSSDDFFEILKQTVL